jgi:hypothetical protein
MCSCNSTKTCVSVELKLIFYWTNANISTLLMCHVQLRLNRNMCCSGVEVELRLSHCEQINSVDESCATATQPKHMLQSSWSWVSIEPMRTYQLCWRVCATQPKNVLQWSLSWVTTGNIWTLLMSEVKCYYICTFRWYFLPLRSLS